jgi:hypothetical protein
MTENPRWRWGAPPMVWKTWKEREELSFERLHELTEKSLCMEHSWVGHS